MSERIQIVSEEDVPLYGLERSEAIRRKLWRRASGGLIFSPDRAHVLCHRRSSGKDERKGIWVATFGGKVLENEDVRAAALRELFEEFGVNAESAELHFFDKFRSVERHQFEYVFWLRLLPENCSLLAVDGEVAEWKWLSTRFILRSLGTDPRWYEYGYELKVIRSVTGNSSFR